MSVRPAMMMVPPPVYELFETLVCAHPSREREKDIEKRHQRYRHTKSTPNPNPAKTPTLVLTIVPKKKREPTPEKRKQTGEKQSPKNAPAPAAKPKRALTLPRRRNIQHTLPVHRGRSLSVFERINPNLPVLAAARHQAVVEPNARHGPAVSHKGGIALAAARLPALDHAVVGAADDADGIAGQRPHALEVAEHGLEALARGAVPQPDGAVERAREEVARRQRARRVRGEGGAVHGADVLVARGRRAAPVRVHEGDGRGPVAAARDGEGVGVVACGVAAREQLVVGLVLGREEEDLLDVADVAFKGANDLARVQVPELEGGVVRGGHDGPAVDVEACAVDPVAVALEAEGLLGVEVEDLDALIDRAAREQLGFKVQADNAVGVALKRRDALAGMPVPDLDGVCRRRSEVRQTH